jgi:hypothetical protein
MLLLLWKKQATSISGDIGLERACEPFGARLHSCTLSLQTCTYTVAFIRSTINHQ